MTRYSDRADAGRRLAASLPDLTGALVLGLPRGGVVVAHAVVQERGGELGVLVVRKLGAPHHEEYGVGAVAEDDPPLWDPAAVRSFDAKALDRVLRRETQELARRQALYRGGPLPPLADRHVVVVDDGLATGVTARAALRRVRRDGPSRLVLAVPVGAPDTVAALRSECDEVVCPEQPVSLGAVGAAYDDFRATEDREVLALLGRG